MTMVRLGAGILIGMLASGWIDSVAAQLVLRPTGESIAAELVVEQAKLAEQATRLSAANLTETSQKMGVLAESLRNSLGKDISKPLDLLDTGDKGAAYRALAVVSRSRAYLEASKGCNDADASAMATALATTVDKLSQGGNSSKVQPVLSGVETSDHRPLFVLHGGDKNVAFALTGENLFDAQCENPVVTATDVDGKPLAIQPEMTGVSPARIELKMADSTGLLSGPYVLHVASKRKAFMVGCTAQPETLAALEVAKPVSLEVSYSVSASCNGQAAAAPATGKLPVLHGAGTVSQQVALGSCDNPVSYTISAKGSLGSGQDSAVGPITQIASAGITTGLPGGYTLSWDPSVRQLFLRSSASQCKGIY